MRVARVLAGVGVVMVVAAVLVTSTPVGAATHTVTNGNDSGAGSYRQAIADAATDRVLGVHIVGSDAGNMIAEAAIVMEFGGAAEDIARTCHAHPTLPEAVKEAAMAVAKRAIHM